MATHGKSKTSLLAGPRGAMATARLKWFLRSEDGAILPFALIMFVLMLMAGGMAIDLMRRENARVILQNTVDRAVLAAADLDQLEEAEDVVNGYFDAAGLRQYLIDVDVDEGLNYRTVSAETAASIDMFFLNMVGIETMVAPAASTAEERIQNVEISLVVDISGSMGGSRMNNLKNAADEFIDTVIAATPPTGADSTGITSLSIIPYQAMVSLGDDLGAQFNLSNEHGYSHCAVFDFNDYADTAIAPGDPLERMAHFDRSTTSGASPIWNPHCPVVDDEAIIAYSISRSDLKDKIDDLSAGGNTAIDVGMKWGVALLDPAARPAINALEDAGVVNEHLRDRPADYSDRETLKVVVLMTDGANTTQYDLKPEFKGGLSNVWWHEDDDRYSVYTPGWNDYWYPHNGTYNTRPYRGTGESRRLSHAELFARYSVRYIAEHFFRTPDPNNQYNAYRNAVASIVNGTEADRRSRELCNVARQRGIVVFAIGFEAPSRGQELMRDCASTPSHYFDVSGVEISEAFSAIARTINQLRLTQ